MRRAIVRSRLEPPKTRHVRRDVPVSSALVDGLLEWHKTTEWPGPEDLVFPTLTGGPHDYGNLGHRVLAPTAQEAGVPWINFHTFRHTAASMLFEQGRNAKQVQRWSGHHSAAFALDRYIHLLSDELDEPLELPHVAAGAQIAARRPTAYDAAGRPGSAHPVGGAGAGLGAPAGVGYQVARPAAPGPHFGPGDHRAVPLAPGPLHASSGNDVVTAPCRANG